MYIHCLGVYKKDEEEIKMEKWLKKSYPLIMLALLFVQAIISPLTVWAQTTLGENKSIVNLKELSQEDTF